MFIAPKTAPQDAWGGQDPNYAFVLSEAAAEWLCRSSGLKAFGTSWKSCDFQPSSRKRPVHHILLRQAVIFENLRLEAVPEGEYFLSAFPLPLVGASESPVCPVLFTGEELLAGMRAP